MRAPRLAGLAVTFVALALVGCAGAGSGGQTAASGTVEAEDAWILGQWRIASEDGSGPTLVMVMDSVANNFVHGHVLRYMAGNSGRGPRDFRPFRAEYSADEPITVTVEWVDTNSPPIGIVLQRVGAALEIHEFELGGEDMTARGRGWVMMRIER